MPRTPSRTLANRAITPGGPLLAAGVLCLVVGIGVVIARLATPTPAIVIAAVLLLIAGFTLAANGILALLSHPIWTEGTVRDRRWTVSGVRRVGAVVLDVGAAEPLVVQVTPAVYTALTVGDRVRVQHDSLNRARVYRVELLAPAA